MVIINILSSSRISIEFMMRNTILALDDCVNIDNILAFPQHKSGSWFVLYLESLLTSVCYVLPWSITIFYVKNVVRISPPLKNS